MTNDNKNDNKNKRYKNNKNDNKNNKNYNKNNKNYNKKNKNDKDDNKKNKNDKNNNKNDKNDNKNRPKSAQQNFYMQCSDCQNTHALHVMSHILCPTTLSYACQHLNISTCCLLVGKLI